ncbi:MAG TPA: ABC transporter substrate binding protein [Thermodesulfobacteriota bacterium]|nr:ABC transporter substrate binding protein [Thermodesulfobacteriota bacterium]
MLYSEDRDNPGQEAAEQGIRAGFRSNKPFDVQLYTEYLDVSRFGDHSHARTMANFLRRKFSGMKIDAIISVYPYALDFLLANGRGLFPEVPVVAAAITRTNAENLERSPARRFITGTIARANVTVLMDSILRLRPKTKRIALVAGTAANDILSDQQNRAALKPYAEKINLIDLTGLSMKDTLSRVGSLSPDTIVLYSTILRDGAGKSFVSREALSLIARASKVPVFGFFESYLGFGIVGGRLLSLREHGREAAGLALRVMGGESPASIPFGGEQAYVIIYDWRELKRWGISEKSLPPGSIVEFKSLSLWEEHKIKILGGLFFITIETLLIIGLISNLYKRRRAEAEIAASELRYRTVADYNYDWEYWSAADGKLNYVSPACERITGYSVREFTDDPSLFERIIVTEDSEIWDAHDHHDPSHSKPRIQFRIHTKGGEIRWIDHACLPVKDPQGRFLGIRASNKDITDRKKAEFEVQQQRNELTRVIRVATMGELTSSLAHELNQPLAAIRNYANAAQRFLSQSEPNLAKAREALEGIVRDDKRAAEIINGVRGLLKKEEPCYRLVHMNHVIEDILAFIRSDSVLEGVSFETELAPGLPAVLGDRVQLQQVLLNLMLNALDAINEAKPDLRRIVIKTENEVDGGVKVSIKDFGAGIDETHREKLFEPFHTTKPGGMGMGLAISERIIGAHGGSIWGENNPDRGATFYFTVPSTEK